MENIMADVAVIGAGPIGVECSVNLKINAVSHVLIDSSCLGNTIMRWTDNTQFLSSPERLEIAAFPFQNKTQMSPSGEDYLGYLRSIVEYYNLPLRTFHKIVDLQVLNPGFLLKVQTLQGSYTLEARKLILATGAMNKPEKLNIKGDDLPFVHNSEHPTHLYFRKKVLVVGDGNSALEKVIRIFRLGGKPHLIIQDEKIDAAKVRFEYLRELKLLLEKQKVKLWSKANLTRIEPDGNCIIAHGYQENEKYDFVISCIGYSFETSLLQKFGIQLKDGDIPVFDNNTMQTNVDGIYLAGTIAGGKENMPELFIGTCHDHVEKIIKSILPEPFLKTGSPVNRDYSFQYDDVQFPPEQVNN